MNETTATPTTDATGAAIGSRVQDVVRRPCPFCGGPARVLYHKGEYCVACVNADGLCLVEPCTSVFRERLCAITAWNQTPNANLERSARSGDTLQDFVRCADCGREVPRMEATEQTTFEGTKVRCEPCGDAAEDRALRHHGFTTPN